MSYYYTFVLKISWWNGWWYHWPWSLYSNSLMLRWIFIFLLCGKIVKCENKDEFEGIRGEVKINWRFNSFEGFFCPNWNFEILQWKCQWIPQTCSTHTAHIQHTANHTENSMKKKTQMKTTFLFFIHNQSSTGHQFDMLCGKRMKLNNEKKKKLFKKNLFDWMKKKKEKKHERDETKKKFVNRKTNIELKF